MVELSIVLVIIGLLIGGILAAQSMIETAKILKVVRTLQQYEAVINNFKTRYNYYPGDAPYFTIAGNGNGVLDTAGQPGTAGVNEGAQVFAHLSQASTLR